MVDIQLIEMGKGKGKEASMGSQCYMSTEENHILKHNQLRVYQSRKHIESSLYQSLFVASKVCNCNLQ